MSVSQDNVPQSDAPPIDDRPEIVTAPIAGSNELVLRTPMVAVGNLSTGSPLEVRVNGGQLRIAPVGEGDVAALPPLKQGVNNVLFRQIAADGKASDRPWTRIDVDHDGSATLSGLRQGANTAVFRQIAADGTPSANQSVKIRFDSIAPPRPLVALRRFGPNGLTNDPALRVGTVETDARIEYSVNGGAWSDVYAPADGAAVVRIRAVDEAGNASRPSSPVRFTLDRSAAAPAVALRIDSGEPADRITKDGRLRVTGVEPGARVEYSTDDGRTWRRSFVAGMGPNDVLVRQVDRAGNRSAATEFAFTKVRGHTLSSLVLSTTGNDGVKGSIKNLTDQDVEISMLGSGDVYLLKPKAEVVFYDSKKISDLSAGCEGIDFFFARKYQRWLDKSCYHRIAIGDPDIGRPDTLYQFHDWYSSPHTYFRTIRRAWNQQDSHLEIAYNRQDKTPAQFWIKREGDGWDGGHETKDTKDWQVFTIHIDKI